MTTAVEDRGTLRVLPGSEFEASCDCEDFQWHKEAEQSESEFSGRKGKAGVLQVIDISVKYGTVIVKTRTSDGGDNRFHEVILSRGDGPGWVCKHIVRALKTKALMPQHSRKEVFMLEEQANAEAQKHEDALVTTVNNAYVVGWDYCDSQV